MYFLSGHRSLWPPGSKSPYPESMGCKPGNVSWSPSSLSTTTQLPWTKGSVLQIYWAQPPATQWKQSTAPHTLVYIQVPFQDNSPCLIFTITNPWFHPSKMKLTHVTLSIPPLEDVRSNIITLDYGHCHSPKTLAPILCPSCPSTAIITLTSLNSIQTRASIRPNTRLYPVIRPSGQPGLAVDLHLGFFF